MSIDRSEKGLSWDKPVVLMPQVERQLLSNADVQRSSFRRGVPTEAGPLTVRQVSGDRIAKTDIVVCETTVAGFPTVGITRRRRLLFVLVLTPGTRCEKRSAMISLAR